MQDLDPIQHEPLHEESDVPLADVRENGLRLLVYVGGAMVLLSVLAGATLTVPRYLSEPFTLRSTERAQLYQFFDDLYLEETFVDVGEAVDSLRPLVRISSPALVEEIATFEGAVRELELFEGTERAMYRSQIEALRLEEARLEDARRSVEAQKQAGWHLYEKRRQQAAFEVEQAQARLGRERTLYDKKLISAEQLRTFEETLVAATSVLDVMAEERRKEVAALDAQARQAALERDIAAQQRLEKEKELERVERVLRTAMQEAYDRIHRAYGPFAIDDGTLLLKAPQAGRISYVSTTEREVEKGAVLLKLERRGRSGLYAHASISPQRIGQVERGAPVVLKVSTFPHYDWGVLRGHVRSVSLSPDDRGYYACEVEIDDPGRLETLVSAGMTGELSILAESKSLFGLLFEDVKRGYFSLMR